MTLPDRCASVGHGGDVDQLEHKVVRFLKLELDEPEIAGAVFDDEKANGEVCHNTPSGRGLQRSGRALRGRKAPSHRRFIGPDAGVYEGRHTGASG
jgi:hypothetical protein